jgi:hypothetical protein
LSIYRFVAEWLLVLTVQSRVELQLVYCLAWLHPKVCASPPHRAAHSDVLELAHDLPNAHLCQPGHLVWIQGKGLVHNLLRCGWRLFAPEPCLNHLEPGILATVLCAGFHQCFRHLLLKPPLLASMQRMHCLCPELVFALPDPCEVNKPHTHRPEPSRTCRVREERLAVGGPTEHDVTFDGDRVPTIRWSISILLGGDECLGC